MNLPVLFLLLLLSLTGQAQPTSKFIRENAVAIQSGHALPWAVYRQIRKHKVIAVGEIHGTKEAPRIVVQLLQLLETHGKSVLLALEIPQEMQAPVNRFLKSGDVSFLRKSSFFTRPYQDGRSSRSMVHLLDRIRTLKGISVSCFDPANATGGQDRDEIMARNIAKAYLAGSFDFLVILAGNIHTRISEGTPFDPTYRPMAYELHHQGGAIFSESEILPIRVRNEFGDAWVCLGPKTTDCKVHPMAAGKSTYTEAVPFDQYFLNEHDLYEGHRATFFTRTFSASRPLVGH